MLLSAWQRDLPRDAGARTLMVRRMLAEILNERLREALREDLGACYAPTAYYRAHEMENGYGMYQVNVETDGKQMEAASKALDRVTNALAQDGVTTAELEKLLPATLAGWKTSRESNELWLDLLVQEYLTKRPCVVWNDSLPELLQSITKKELDAEAAAAFTPQGRAQLTVVKGEEQAK